MLRPFWNWTVFLEIISIYSLVIRIIAQIEGPGQAKIRGHYEDIELLNEPRLGQHREGQHGASGPRTHPTSNCEHVVGCR